MRKIKMLFKIILITMAALFISPLLVILQYLDWATDGAYSNTINPMWEKVKSLPWNK